MFKLISNLINFLSNNRQQLTVIQKKSNKFILMIKNIDKKEKINDCKISNTVKSVEVDFFLSCSYSKTLVN